jgi:hypothetical protein
VEESVGGWEVESEGAWEIDRRGGEAEEIGLV